MHYRQHLFFCVNLRVSGQQCCAQAGAVALRDYAKRRIKALGLAGPGGVRINQAGCLGRCSEGPSLVVYPEGVWYRYKDENDIDRIIEEHIIGGRVVTALLMQDNA